jgi:hypothetical protein
MKNILFIIPLICWIFFFSCEKEDEQRVTDTNYNPEIIPANFSDSVTNEYFPLYPGTVYTYTAQTPDGAESIVVTVLADTKMVAGVKCTVVHDVVSMEGQVIEDTYDWYAQDKDGNVWYMGEDVSNYENGKLVDKEGSFEAGIDGAKPGIIMFANPVLEMPYRQEYHCGVAEDWGKVVAKGQTITVPYGTFGNCIKTEDWNALEPDLPVEYKYYAPGIGVIKEEAADGSEVVEIVGILIQ